MNNFQNIFKWASGSLALVPGLTVVLTNLGTPPTISKLLYGGIVEAIGAFTFLMLYLNRKKISEMSDKKIKTYSIIMFVLFFVSLLTYTVLYNSQVVYSPKYDTKIFFPFWFGDELGFMIKDAGSKLNAITNYGPQAVADAIVNAQPSLEITGVIFTTIYVSIFVFLIIGFGLPGFKLSDHSELSASIANDVSASAS